MVPDVLSPIYIDRRTGSAELYAPLVKRRVPVELTTLEYGDFAFIGHGPDGAVLVGIERKRITDLLQSMQTGRLSGHQLPGLHEHYAYRWLLVEGAYRESPHGTIELPRKQGAETIGIQYTAVENYLLTLTMRGGIHVQRTYDQFETASWLHSLWLWWTAKEYHDHRAHLSLHQQTDPALFYKPTLVHRMAAELPGIDETAKSVAAKFPTVVEMVTAEESEWRTIPGIGKVKASRIHKALRTRG